MVMLQFPLLFIGLLATLATLGIFYQFADPWTGVLVGFSAAVMWGVFGISSYDVIIDATANPPTTEALLPLVYLGVGMAIVTALFAINDLIHALKDDVTTSADQLTR